jgi:hypothetical protein
MRPSCKGFAGALIGILSIGVFTFSVFHWDKLSGSEVTDSSYSRFPAGSDVVQINDDPVTGQEDCISSDSGISAVHNFLCTKSPGKLIRYKAQGLRFTGFSLNALILSSGLGSG